MWRDRSAAGDARKDAEASGCSCALPHGCWGQQGWHFTRMTEEMVRKKWRIDLEEWEAEENRENRRELCRIYVGQKVAYERCGGYAAGVERRKRENGTDQVTI